MSDADPLARRLRLRLAGLGVLLALLIGLGIAWTWSPLKSWLDIDLIVGALRQLGQASGPAAAIAGFALAVATAVPLTFLTLVAIIAFGPWTGVACALPGALIGAAISYGVGAALGRDAVERLGGKRVNAVSERLARSGVLAIVLVRMVPVAPFAIVNMVAGASRIRLRDLLLGTAIGMMPSTVFMMLFMDSILASFKQPSRFGTTLVIASALLLVLGGWGIRRWLRRVKEAEARAERIETNNNQRQRPGSDPGV
ncbi:MAG: TVP38/TMEM64 family protein [Pseudomonadota bacterium]